MCSALACSDLVRHFWNPSRVVTFYIPGKPGKYCIEYHKWFVRVCHDEITLIDRVKMMERISLVSPSDETIHRM